MQSGDKRPVSALHRLEFAAFRAIERLLAGVPMADLAAVGRIAGRVFQWLSPRYRRIVRRNLRIATAGDPPSPQEIDGLTRETFGRAGANFLAALRTPTLGDKALEATLEADGMEWMGGRGTGRRGLILAMPHMGNWEALAAIGWRYIGDAGHGGVYRPLNNPLMDARVREQRTARGSRLFSRADGFHAPAAMLREGGVLAILSDQRAGGRGAAIPFFGKLTTCSPLPALLARRGRAEVAVLTIHTLRPGCWRFRLRPLAGAASTAEIMDALEAGMRASLTDVFWFHDRWRIDPALPLSLFAPLDPEVAAAATVPLRLLMTLPDTFPADWLPGLVERFVAIRPDLRIELAGGAAIDHPAVTRHDRDPDQPPEHAEGWLAKVDASHPAPLDGALLFGSEPALARAAKRIGLRAIIGLDVVGKPWSRSLPRPPDESGWLAIPESLSFAPRRRMR